MAEPEAAAPPGCESCGAADGALAPVRRVYLDTGDDGEVRSTTTAPDVERWCASCRATYPHEPA